jgi:predicted AlkP superfamily pyrophosphatase or phosphodiesterase
MERTRSGYLRKTLQMLTLHFTALDPVGHDTGPFTAEALAILERLDAVIGNLREVAERLAPGRACISVVSDHGFAKTGAPCNLFPSASGANIVDGP